VARWPPPVLGVLVALALLGRDPLMTGDSRAAPRRDGRSDRPGADQ